MHAWICMGVERTIETEKFHNNIMVKDVANPLCIHNHYFYFYIEKLYNILFIYFADQNQLFL